jgi:purine-nucleoside phosphorylase
MSVHIGAKPGEIAEAVLLPGDPLRAKFIAETWFENPVLYSEIRGMLGYTGTYRGKRVSVQGTGMGQPSLAIYANELMREYGVKTLIRVGTCGSVRPEVGLREVVLAMAASTDSSANRIRFRGMDYAPTADFGLLLSAYEECGKAGIAPRVGPILSSDAFYTDDPEQWKLWARFGVLAIEMESAELYTLAAKYGRRALSVLTVSDNIATGGLISSEERQLALRTMAEIALATAVKGL